MAFGFPASFTKTIHCDKPAAQVRASIQEAIMRLSWAVKNETEARVVASVSLGMASYGERVVIDFLPNGDLRITSSCVFPMQWIDWGKNRKNVEELEWQLSML